MLTIKDIAKKAGVSQATVSRVINNTKPVKPETRKRVQCVIDRYHYQPNVHASCLGRSNRISIGIAYFSDMDESFAMLSEIERLAQKYNVPTQIRSADMNATSELDSIQSLLSHGCKIILVHALYSDDSTLALLANNHPEIYFVDRKVPNFEHRCAWFEHEKAGRLLAATALRKKPAKCWLIFRHDPDKNTREREQGIINTLTSDKNFGCPYETVRTAISARDGENILHDILSLGEKPETIIVDAGTTAVGIGSAYSDCVPEYVERLMIVSFGGSTMVNMYNSKITRVNYPLSHMATKLLTKAIVDQANIHQNEEICLHPTLDRDIRSQVCDSHSAAYTQKSVSSAPFR